MEMVGKNADCDCFEGVAAFDRSVDAPKVLDVAQE
jgi:hypothetical protein